MSATIRLTDDAIRAALTPERTVQAPAGLADAIRSSIDSTPQRRSGLLGWTPSPRTRLVVQLAVAGLLLLGLVLGALLIGSRLSARPALSTYHGGPERTGVMPGPGPEGAPPLIAWQKGARGPFGPWSPVVVGGTVYVGDKGGFVTAWDVATGDVQWQVQVGSSINSGLTVDHGRVVVGDDDGTLHVLDAASGGELWQYPGTAAIHGSAAVVDGVAYIGSTNGQLYALDLASYELRWVVTTPGDISRAVAVSDGIVYAGSGRDNPGDPGSLGAYDAATGTLLWQAKLEPGNTSTPTVTDGRVFVSGGLDATETGDHHVFAFDATTGDPVWSPFAAPSGEGLLLGPVTDGVVYALGTGGSLYVLDATTGDLQWPPLPIQSTQSPNAGIVGDTLYVTSDDQKVHAINTLGPSELWAVDVPGTPGAPAVIGGSIFVTTSLGKVVRIGGSGAATQAEATP